MIYICKENYPHKNKSIQILTAFFNFKLIHRKTIKKSKINFSENLLVFKIDINIFFSARFLNEALR
jgi:hypothetical protein